MSNESLVESEVQRIRTEYKRRERELDLAIYAPWQPGEMFMVTERERVAATVLKATDKFPKAGDHCLEIGYGKLGWLGRMISWGLADSDLHGIELDAERAAIAKKALPGAELLIGNAVELPWQDNSFRIVIVSTLFSSILDADVQMLIAKEMNRVLEPGGVVLWYDTSTDNPRNINLKGISKNRIRELFPEFDHNIRSVTLAPPISRRVAGFSWTLASMLSSLPFLRTHLLGVLVKH